MILTSLIATLRIRLAKRAQYLKLVKEIESMTYRDLCDIRADRNDLLIAAWNQVYR